MFLAYFLLSIANAQCVNQIAQSEIAAAIAHTPGAGAKVCGGEDPCVCFDGTDFSVASIGLVDDPSRPKFLKRNVQACIDIDCKSDLRDLSCSEGTRTIAADYATVYCAVPNGYEQKPGGLFNDPAKVAALKASADAAQARAAKVQEGIRQQDVGRRIIAFMKISLDEKNLDTATSVGLSAQIAPITGLLQLGSIPTAKTLVQQLTVSGPITQDYIDLTLEQFKLEGY